MATICGSVDACVLDQSRGGQGQNGEPRDRGLALSRHRTAMLSALVVFLLALTFPYTTVGFTFSTIDPEGAVRDISVTGINTASQIVGAASSFAWYDNTGNVHDE